MSQSNKTTANAWPEDIVAEAEKLIERAEIAAKPDPTATGKSAERTEKILARAYAKMGAREDLRLAREAKNGARKDAGRPTKRKL